MDIRLSVKKIRETLASFDPSASHTVSGDDRPQVTDMYAPEHHAGALDPRVSMVLGARGSGKSFWAGVLGNGDTIQAAAKEFPRLGLEKLIVGFGFVGNENVGAVSQELVDTYVPEGRERQKAPIFWRVVILRAVYIALNPKDKNIRIKELLNKYSDPEELQEELERLDAELQSLDKVALILFDALDALAYEQERLRGLLDALLQVTWATRSYRAIRLKLFLRDDQVEQLGLQFVELPKLKAGATRLRWDSIDLYGMLFLRLARSEECENAFNFLLKESGFPLPSKALGRGGVLAKNEEAQANLFFRMSGPYMGSTVKQGKTYSWIFNHLKDGYNEVTPRSFLALMIHAAKHKSAPENTVISAEGIRHGLREASKIRVEQLAVEFPWIRRALAPLAGLLVPCHSSSIINQWSETGTISAIRKLGDTQHFLLPFSSADNYQASDELLATLMTIGVVIERGDGRFDMPDLFRVAAKLLKKGGERLR